jgi:hypothetical protein
VDGSGNATGDSKRRPIGFVLIIDLPLTPTLSHRGRGVSLFAPPLMGGMEGRGNNAEE